MPETKLARPSAAQPIADAAAQEAAGALRSVRDGWGDFLYAYRWDHFVTLSFERAVSPARAVRDFTDGFVRRAAFEARRPLAWFCALERSNNCEERVHIHALVAGTAGLRTDQLERAWKVGNTRVLRYDSSRGAARYVVKSLLAGADDYDISRRWPPRLTPTSTDERDNCGVSQLISHNTAA